jgi:hypothetical protein
LSCVFRGTDDEAFGYLKRVIVTPAVYPRFVQFLHFDIQSIVICILRYCMLINLHI